MYCVPREAFKVSVIIRSFSFRGTTDIQAVSTEMCTTHLSIAGGQNKAKGRVNTKGRGLVLTAQCPVELKACHIHYLSILGSDPTHKSPLAIKLFPLNAYLTVPFMTYNKEQMMSALVCY